jgi:hypothetical protein
MLVTVTLQIEAPDDDLPSRVMADSMDAVSEHTPYLAVKGEVVAGHWGRRSPGQEQLLWQPHARGML